MTNKEKLAIVENEAREASLKNENEIYYVINKKRNDPCFYNIAWLAMRKINSEGYYPVCTYKNGIRH